ncbi:MAG: ABC transporter permease, partial [Longimicrobiales bacterium]
MTPERRGAPVFGILLRLFPRDFRAEHGAGMQELFEARLARARGLRGRIGVWSRGLVDVLRTAWAVRTGAEITTGRRRGGGRTMDSLLQDLKQTLRHLVRAPVFTLGAVLLLAVGIGANTTVFTVVDGLLFRPPPWGDADEVVYVYQDSDDGEPNSTSFPAYRDMTEVDVFESVAAVTPNSATLEGTDGPVAVDIEYATASLMDVLGLAPARGRWFGPEHDVVGNAYAAVVSWPAWVSRFGADPDLVGSTVRLNGQPVTVVGVGPRTLPSSFPPFVTDFWLSISSTPLGGDFMVANLDRRADHWYDVRARLAEGVTPEQASAAMDALATRLATDFPEFNQGRGITVFRADEVRAHPSVDGDLFAAGTLLGAVVAVVLLLACANLANLLLVRGLGRSGEMAVRRAMGAGSGRVARLFFLEA